MPRGAKMLAIGQARDTLILDALKRGPMTVMQLAEAIGACRSGVAVRLARMNAAPRRVFISAYNKRGRGRPQPIWSMGDQENVEFVPNGRPTSKPSLEDRRNQVLALLRKGPRTARQLAEEIHVVKERAVLYVGQLRRAKLVHISRWLHPSQFGRGGMWVPVYALGNKPDKVRVIENPADRHARLSASPEYVAQRRKERKLRYQVEKTRRKPQTIFSALGV